MGDLFSGFKGSRKKTININQEPTKTQNNSNPPNLATLNFDKKSESEIAIGEKFNNKKLLPNYTKNPELQLQQSLIDLKGGNNPNQFKKYLEPTNSKIQPIPLSPNLPTIPPQQLKKHLNELTNNPSNSIPVTNEKPVNSPPNCKFLNNPSCHPDYPNFSGASIQFPENSKMKCDSIGNEKQAKTVCTISNGKINGIYIIDEGTGYSSNPKVEAIGGGGENAQLEAIVNDGKIKDIKIINGGTGFHETPIIKIESPNMSNGCYLCCK